MATVHATESLTIELGERSYPIYFGGAGAETLARDIAQARQAGRSLAVVTDDNVRRALAALFDGPLQGVPCFSVPPGEASKSLLQFGRLCESLAGERIDRGGLLLAVGGGVVGDLAGFAAAAYLRGIEYWQVPTTLLAMVDSAVGGKTGINLYAGKNLVGAFHQPRAVYCDTKVLATLPPREFAAGMAEVIKYGLLGDAAMFDALGQGPRLTPADDRLPAIVRRCCAIKAGIVKDDEHERAASGGRALLNLGHTFAHAIEAVAGYGAYLHGEAVGVGLAAAARLSQQLDLISRADVARIDAVVTAHDLPVRLREPLPATALLEAMRRDKKVKHGRLRFVVLEAIGRAATRDDVAPSLAAGIWSELGAK